MISTEIASQDQLQFIQLTSIRPVSGFNPEILDLQIQSRNFLPHSLTFNSLDDESFIKTLLKKKRKMLVSSIFSFSQNFSFLSFTGKCKYFNHYNDEIQDVFVKH